MATELTESSGITSPWPLMRTMIDKGGDPDVLKKIADMAERWEDRQAERAFMKAFNACQAEVPRVFKATKGERGMYAVLEVIQDAVMPVVHRHGFSLSWNQGEAPTAGITRVLATLFHTGGHAKEYQGDYAIDGIGPQGKPTMNPIQGRV